MWVALWTMLRQISAGSRSVTSETRSATSCDSTSSQTPSDAITMQMSASVISCSVISGSAMTPTVAAAWSPMERAIASPRRLCHTREGDPFAPAGVTCPPQASIRCISTGVSGFWSKVMSTATRRFDFGACRQMIARESPELASQMWFPRTMLHTAVVPETDASQCSASERSTSQKAERSASPGSVASEACAESTPGRVLITYCDTTSPTLPCPSKTPPTKHALSPANGHIAIARSWLIFCTAPPGTGSSPATECAPHDAVGGTGVLGSVG
mmetsp:Transcript_26081/g.86881  ORF Transcript_26081/g.86881 Transcript_26081/m.86881 type:complete len:271 (+) Transcript_26081:370-1182(+)